MFTGIIDNMGAIEALEQTPTGGRLRIRAKETAPLLHVGSSIAVNGCCLTVTDLAGEVFACDLSGETLRRTSFGELKPGTKVNLELPLKAGAEFGGHFVQGHVDGVGRVTRLVPEGENWWLSAQVPDGIARYVAMKGSIAIDGISLTVAGWKDGVVDIAIIPYTYTHTNVCQLAPGDPVNLECDVLAKYVERLLEAHEPTAPSRLTVERLIEEGF